MARARKRKGKGMSGKAMALWGIVAAVIVGAIALLFLAPSSETTAAVLPPTDPLSTAIDEAGDVITDVVDTAAEVGVDLIDGNDDNLSGGEAIGATLGGAIGGTFFGVPGYAAGAAVGSGIGNFVETAFGWGPDGPPGEVPPDETLWDWVEQCGGTRYDEDWADDEAVADCFANRIYDYYDPIP